MEKRRGRPRVDAWQKRGEMVSVRLMTGELDDLARAALARDEPITELIRRGIRRELSYLKKASEARLFVS